MEAVQRHARVCVGAVAPLVLDLRAESVSLRQIAAEMVSKGVRTPRGEAWSADAVRHVILPSGERRRGAPWK